MSKCINLLPLFLTGFIFLSSCSPSTPTSQNRTVSETPENKVQESSNIGPEYFSSRIIGNAVEGRPWITDLTIADLDQNGWLDVIACEGQLHQILWVRQIEKGHYEELVLMDQITGPAHVDCVDFDDDGDLDILVASMGLIFPSNEKIGSVIVLEKTESEGFQKHVLVENVARVTDVRAGDLDGDGDKDLAVTQFGYHQGESRWMENLGNWEFESHIISSLSGGIHSPIADFDADGDLDIAILISQEWEEIHVFFNQSNKGFNTKVVYGSTNEDYGSSGISVFDLDRDADPDILYTNGDAFDYAHPGSRPWHGVQWLENKGHDFFKPHRLGNLAGAYSPIAVDIDGDGDLDVVAVSGFNDWEKPKAVSMMCFENDGNMNFKARPLAYNPTHIIVAKAADMDQDGQMEIVTGSFHAYPPWNKLGRINLWDTPHSIQPDE